MDVDKLAQGVLGSNCPPYHECLAPLARAVLDRGERIRELETERNHWLSCYEESVDALLAGAKERDALKAEVERLRFRASSIMCLLVEGPECGLNGKELLNAIEKEARALLREE